MRRRLAVLATASTAMVALAFLIPLSLLVRTLAEDRAMAEARQLAQLIAPALATGDEASLTIAVQTASALSSDRVTVYRADGRVQGAPAARDALVERAQAGEAFTATLPDGRALLTPLLEAGGQTAVVRVEVPSETLTAGVLASWGVMATLAVILVAGAVVFADRLARTVVAPARDAAAAARAIAGGDRDARAPVSGPPEIADVAAALNALADRLDALLVAEREAAADLSHRLRTPLTALRLDVEALGSSAAADRVAADLDALERGIDRVIRDARRQPDAPRRAVDAARLVDERVRFWAPLADEESRAWHLSTPDAPVPVVAAPGDLEATLDALVGNVFAHTPAGTAFWVDVRVEDGAAVVTIADDGPGMAGAHVIGRGVSARGSTGLGLDIARRTAESAGGRLVLGSRESGGAQITLRLPLAN